mgnify:CR=1 FL=1
MPLPDPHVDTLNQRAVRSHLLALRSRLAGDRFLAALDRHRETLAKANFNPAQPRQPPGGPGAGQWVYEEGYAQGRQPGASVPRTPAARPGIGHNGGPSLDRPPDIPKLDPGDQASRLAKAKEAAKWLALFGARRVPQVALALAAIEGAAWLRTELPAIRSYRDPPKSLEELVGNARQARPGYERHHIVEQQAGGPDGFPRSMIEGAGNVVSIPKYRHREISDWYQTKNPDFGMLSPRDYLRGKSLEEHIRVGHQAMREKGVLNP